MHVHSSAHKAAKKILLVLPAAMLLHACSGSSGLSAEEQAAADAAVAAAAAAAPSEALFDPNGTPPVIPFPSTLVFAGSEDSTINIPVEDPADLSNPLVGINQLDGFSTISPILSPLSLDLNPDTVAVGTSVVVVEVEANIATGFLSTGVIAPLGPDDIEAFAEPGNLVLQPLKPLIPNSTYLVLLTDALEGTNGVPLARSSAYELLAGDTIIPGDPEVIDLATIEIQQANIELQQIIQSHLAVADGVGVPRDTVGLSFTFNTQSIRETLGALQSITIPQPLLVTEASATTSEFGGSGNADIWIGTLDVPYYQTAVGENGAADALDGFWAGEGGSLLTASNPFPVTTGNSNPNGTETIPVLLSVPNGTSALGGELPAAGWPVAIFQHGINQDRTDLFAVADAMANVGFAVIAIDMPMHGITTETPPLSLLVASETAFPGDRERHFDIDVVNTLDPLDPLPDGVIDDSGTHFINLSNLPNSRDNLRQAVADLLVLSTSLSGVQNSEPAGRPVMFDISRKAFIGHSLGAIVGSVFLSYDTTIGSGTLANPGSGIAQLLAASETISPAINAGLTAAGIAPGSPEFDQFLVAAQTLVDSADPANHASALVATGTPIHMIQVLNDQTVPNSVQGAPLSGGTPMAALLGLPTVTASTTGSALVQFRFGSHRSFLNASSNPAATLEMQNQMAVFAASNGVELPILNSVVIDIPSGEPIPDVTPEADPDVTPEANPDVTPETNPEVTPETNPEVAPE